MSLTIVLIGITILMIAAIAIISVKLFFRGDELAHEEGSILPSAKGISNIVNIGKRNTSPQISNSRPSSPRSLSPESNRQPNLFRKSNTQQKDNNYIVHEVEDNHLENYEYENENQVLVNYNNTVEKTQEPIKESQMDIMTQNKNTNEKTDETSELKDLFTIDELIKESKRKDSEREKEAQQIKREEDQAEIDDLKESIKSNKEEPLIEEVIVEDEKEETISDLISDSPEEEKAEIKEIPSVASQKDVDEAISTASQESKEEVESISEDDNITDALLNQESDEKEAPKGISEPALKTPSKVDKTKDYELGASIDDADLFEDSEEDTMDLDYRKDLNKVKRRITDSKLYQEVRGRFTPETEEVPQTEETYIRNVNEYDEYEPIINETHVDYDGSYEEYHDERLRQENTRKVFQNTKTSREPQLAKPKATEIKNKPARSNIKITLNNNEVVLKKGDEIIFNHDGETYSSQVYAINGDDISVKYRRRNIKIKPGDVKKIY